MASRSSATNTEAVVPSTVRLVGLHDGGSRSSPFCNPCFGRVFLRYDTTHRAVFDMFLHVFDLFLTHLVRLGTVFLSCFMVFLHGFEQFHGRFMVFLRGFGWFIFAVKCKR